MILHGFSGESFSYLRGFSVEPHHQKVALCKQVLMSKIQSSFDVGLTGTPWQTTTQEPKTIHNHKPIIVEQKRTK